MSSLWPEAIKPGIISPYSVLKEQADALSGQTSGLLLGKVERSFYERPESYEGPHKRVTILTLDIVVPGLDNFRWGILKAAHNEMFPYPVVLDRISSLYSFGSFLETDNQKDLAGRKPNIRADTVEEFRSKIAEILTSPNIVSTAQALIARVSEDSAD
jgi:hypothetical protein